MERIYNFYIDAYLKEISDLEIGYTFNETRLCYLKRILKIIYYLENTDLTPQEAINIIETVIQ